MAVEVKMYAIAQHPPDHVGAQKDQHDSDQAFEPPRDLRRNDSVGQENRAAHREKSGAVAQSPDRAQTKGLPQARAAACQGSDRCNVIGLQRMAR